MSAETLKSYITVPYSNVLNTMKDIVPGDILSYNGKTAIYEGIAYTEILNGRFARVYIDISLEPPTGKGLVPITVSASDCHPI